ncbi:MAG: serine hydrolase domain-containing protein [Pirellulales bacterium]|nr:serine hydrolase domain-containing protein [Pirellulales bacterium]
MSNIFRFSRRKFLGQGSGLVAGVFLSGKGITAQVTAGVPGELPTRLNDALPNHYQGLEQVAKDFQQRVNASAATLAVSRHGKLLHTFGCGTRDQAGKIPVAGDDLFRIASITKPLTHALLTELFAVKVLSPRDLVMAKLPPDLAGIAPADKRWEQITLDMLIRHTGGWDRDQTEDPMFAGEKIRRELKLTDEPTPREVVRYMLGQPLQFTPGERTAYSNFGYCLLGRVIEAATGGTYWQALEKYLLTPHRISSVALSRSDPQRRPPREVEYPPAADGLTMELFDAHGGLSASAPALCAVFSNYWISGQRRQPADDPQDWIFFGSLPGTTAVVRQSQNWDLALLFNNRRDERIDADMQSLQAELDRAIDQFAPPDQAEGP